MHELRISRKTVKRTFMRKTHTLYWREIQKCKISFKRVLSSTGIRLNAAKSNSKKTVSHFHLQICWVSHMPVVTFLKKLIINFFEFSIKWSVNSLKTITSSQKYLSLTTHSNKTFSEKISLLKWVGSLNQSLCTFLPTKCILSAYRRSVTDLTLQIWRKTLGGSICAGLRNYSTRSTSSCWGGRTPRFEHPS